MAKKHWQHCLIKPDASIFEAVKVIDEGAHRAAFVVDDSIKLLGIVTDGDIRRQILNHKSMDRPVTDIMNTSPVTAHSSDSRTYLKELMQKGKHLNIPILDERNCLIEVETLHYLSRKPKRDNWVILMAGGLGNRLKPLTENCPKPLLKLGDKPLLETIIEEFIDSGFKNFYVSINYLGSKVRDFLGDGSRWGVNIKYLEEQTALGTAGALRLLPKLPDKPIIVMNGDILTKVDTGRLLDFHQTNSANATICVRPYQQSIPYGIVELEKHTLKSIKEKPTNNYLVNAGIYVLSPDVLEQIPDNQRYDMTSLLNNLLETRSQTVNVFPIREYWMDIGNLDDFQQASSDYGKVFG
jgi:dTDP-glucose pyrophosphorylase